MSLKNALVMCAVAALSLAPQAEAADPAKSEKNLVQTAAGIEQFSTLVAAVKAAGLVDALSGEGPFTVFAPTDEAFAKLPEGTIATLLKPENKEKLQGILKYHVVAGKYPAGKVLQKDSLTTLQGQSLVVKQNAEGAMVGPAKIVKTDVMTSNGVIHVIDAVLLPKDK